MLSNRSRIESNNDCRGMWSKAAVRSTKRRKSGYFFLLVIFRTRFTVDIPSVVPRFDLKPFCSSVSWFSYQGLIRFSMMFMISLQTVDPMLKPRYFNFSKKKKSATPFPLWYQWNVPWGKVKLKLEFQGGHSKIWGKTWIFRELMQEERENSRKILIKFLAFNPLTGRIFTVFWESVTQRSKGREASRYPSDYCYCHCYFYDYEI